ncbi:uncharacterized protein A4U43_C01F4180 [Asparagus officinalis]|uniref:DUF1421 domain-containing protein n=1 Tax=Asparagus officinalis TaxID=4686 RepID=A0A5P1FNC0_ASPOF|nr:uncharacterized protein A4U43_C01F4180 [Asparagus officinalis]
MASGGSSGRTSSGPRSFDFVSDDVLCAYDDYTNQDPPNGNRSDPSPKGFHESRMGRQLVSVYGQQDEYSKEEIIDAVEKCMKKYADNLLRHLVGITGRLSQLEIYCSKLEQSIGEFQADMIRDQSQADTKLKSLEKHLQEPFPQYQQQHWPQPSPQQLTQQAMAPTQPPAAALASAISPAAHPTGYGTNSTINFTIPTCSTSNTTQLYPPSPLVMQVLHLTNHSLMYRAITLSTVWMEAEFRRIKEETIHPQAMFRACQQLLPGNSSGFHVRSHPYMDMIEKAVSMGYPRDQVVGVVNRMAESRQPVDFNALLDRLNSGPAAGGSRW